eukprot:GFKZ01013528.1.p1 GENE.GFKZ01013528.1~~GFKZ01013528.1.p1  ORF type:complete len:929 (-),score=187.03 GFKZ01013528.1:3639-6425(-)
MKHEDKIQYLRGKLEEMGYSLRDLERVLAAGIIEIPNAVDYLMRNQESHPNEQAPLKFHAVHQPNQPTSSSSSMKVEGKPNSESRGIGRARDSIDRSRVQTSVDFGNRPPSTDTDLQKAIMLSRREQEERDTAEALKRSKQQVSTQGEDPDLVRALEESLRDSTARSGQNRGVTWQSHSVPDIKDRMRKDLDQPVGLKNIGNTCYLNSLLQVYYHLPDFRRAIMSVLPPEELSSSPQVQVDSSTPPQNPVGDLTANAIRDNTPNQERLEQKLESSRPEQSFDALPNGDEFLVNTDNRSHEDSVVSRGKIEKKDDRSSEQHAVEFVVELQKLFAAMALGNQSCVDPSGVMHAMRDPEGNPIVIGAQQDASEFNHLFLDIVERGLKYTSTKESARDTGIEVETVADGSRTKDSRDCGEDRMDDGELNVTATSQDAIGGRMINEDVVRMDESQGEGVSNMGGTADGENMEAVMNADAMNSDAMNSEAMNSEAMNAEAMNADGTNAGDVKKAVKKNIVTDMFTMRFRQELQSCGEGDLMNGAKTGEEVKMTVNVGETNAIIVDATTKEFRNLYSGLDDFTYAYVDTVVSEEGAELSDGRTPEGVKTGTQGGSNKGVKRVWFTRMAPVVVIYLQRVRYNRDIFQAEKVYDRYEFETTISLDRYMESNKKEATRAREEVFKLREEMGRIKEMLRKMKEFPHETEGKVSVASKVGQTCKEEFSSSMKRVEMRLTEAMRGVDEMCNLEGISEERIRVALEVIRAVMERDAKICEEMERKLNGLEAEEKRAYEGLEGTKYRLHGVLVHDGAPSGGHYWTYIRNWSEIQDEQGKKAQKGWMRLSDSIVSEVSEEEMLEWAVGGKSLASAYCLIYVSAPGVSASCGEEASGSGWVDGKSRAQESKLLLPRIRIEEVDMENARFIQEVLRAQDGKEKDGA